MDTTHHPLPISSSSLSPLPLTILQAIYHRQTQQYHTFVNKQTTGFYELSSAHSLPYRYLHEQLQSSTVAVRDEDEFPDTSSPLPSFPSGYYRNPSNTYHSVSLPLPVYETDEHRIQQRYRQIEMGKNSLVYTRYRTHVPRYDRRLSSNPPPSSAPSNKYTNSNSNNNHSSTTILYPSTPDPYIQTNKRAWDNRLKRWRRFLHDFNLSHDVSEFRAPPPPSFSSSSSSAGIKRNRSINGNHQEVEMDNHSSQRLHGTNPSNTSSNNNKRSSHSIESQYGEEDTDDNDNNPYHVKRNRTSTTENVIPSAVNRTTLIVENEENPVGDIPDILPITTLPNGSVCVNDLPVSAWDIPYLLYYPSPSSFPSVSTTASLLSSPENYHRSQYQGENLRSYLLHNNPYNTTTTEQNLYDQYTVRTDISTTTNNSSSTPTTLRTEHPSQSIDHLASLSPVSSLRYPVHYEHPLWLCPGQVLNSASAIGNQPIDEEYISTIWNKNYHRIGNFIDTNGTKPTVPSSFTSSSDPGAKVSSFSSTVLMENIQQVLQPLKKNR